MKRQIVLVISLVAGLIAALLTRTYLTVKENEIKAEKAKLIKKYGTVDVLAFSHDTPSGSVLSKADFGKLTVPAMGMRGQAVTEENLSDVIGRKLLVGHKTKEVLFWSDVEGGDPHAKGLSADVKRQMRAMSINVNGAAAVSGMIKPNDHVDVIGTFNFPDDDGKIKRGDPVTCTILQNVLVLATGKDTSKTQSRELGMVGGSNYSPQPQRHFFRKGAPAGRLPEDTPGDGGAQPQAPAEARGEVAMVLTTLIGGDRETRTLADGTYMIGRNPSCPVCFSFPDVSERHAILTVRNGKAIIEDLHSANGTYVNGEQIDGPVTLDSGMVVQIGESMLRVCDENDWAANAAEPAARESPVEEQVNAAPVAEDNEEAPPPDPLRELRRSVQEQIQKELLKRMDMKRLTMQGVDREGLEDTAREKIRQIIDEVVANGRLPDGIDPVRLEDDVFNEAMRLGPLEDLLADDTVSEIMVNGPDKVYIERGGKLILSDCQFTDDASVLSVIERIIAPLGRRCDESQPYVDARLADGSRVNAIIAPLALSGPTITIRKFSKKALTPDDFIRFGTWTHNAAEFMKLCVWLRKNVIVAGGTGSGKTTLLNLLSGYIPHSERIVTVEDAAELRLQQPHVVRLEARPPNIEGKGAVPIRDLVKNCLRMRPDRIIVGECRGGEALDMLQAMNTGHDGSLTTVHANSPRDVISRLETMVLMSGMELPSRAIREQIASAVDIIIHESRLSDGSRKVTAITEVTGLEGNQIVMQDLFAFKQSGVGPDGKIIGEFKPTGAMPTWFDQLAGRGIKCDPRMFDPDCTADFTVERKK